MGKLRPGMLPAFDGPTEAFECRESGFGPKWRGAETRGCVGESAGLVPTRHRQRQCEGDHQNSPEDEPIPQRSVHERGGLVDVMPVTACISLPDNEENSDR